MADDPASLVGRVFELLRECLQRALAVFTESLTIIRSHDIVQIHDRRFAVIRKLGEGGYAFVHLVREQPTPQQPLVDDTPLALKRINASSGERLSEARREITTLRALSHPNCLPLLDHAIVPSDPSAAAAAAAAAAGTSGSTAAYSAPAGAGARFGGLGFDGGSVRGGGGGFEALRVGDDGGGGVGGRGQGARGCTVLLLFPAFEDGTAAEEVARLAAAGRRLETADVLDVFEQICAAVAHMHSRQLAHRDLKPHNVLIVRPENNRPRGGTSLFDEEPPDNASAADGGGGGDWGDADAAERGEGPAARGGGGREPWDSDHGHGGGVEKQQQQRRRRRRYGAVLMDFGSARPAVTRVTNRTDALAAQEDAEAHCTATYRAPELFDVETYATLDAKVDVWSLGCTLYHLMYGASPFQDALDRGASLPLAVLNCRIPWPKPPAVRYPQELHDLVTLCLQVDPAARPTSEQLLSRVRTLRRQRLPGPAAVAAAAAAAARPAAAGARPRPRGAAGPGGAVPQH